MNKFLFVLISAGSLHGAELPPKKIIKKSSRSVLADLRFDEVDQRVPSLSLRHLRQIEKISVALDYINCMLAQQKHATEVAMVRNEDAMDILASLPAASSSAQAAPAEPSHTISCGYCGETLPIGKHIFHLQPIPTEPEIPFCSKKRTDAILSMEKRIATLKMGIEQLEQSYSTSVNTEFAALILSLIAGKKNELVRLQTLTAGSNIDYIHQFQDPLACNETL